jgi:uncharacterized protein with HEPN domain
MSNEFLDYVEDILEAMDQAEICIEGMSYEQFEVDIRTHFAVTRALEIVGEATKRLPQHIRQQYHSIPWKGMAGMRDRIIHGYDKVDLRIVWDVVKQDIPHIKLQPQQILADYED